MSPKRHIQVSHGQAANFTTQNASQSIQIPYLSFWNNLSLASIDFQARDSFEENQHHLNML